MLLEWFRLRRLVAENARTIAENDRQIAARAVAIEHFASGIRREALEEAAKACDRLGAESRASQRAGQSSIHPFPEHCAEAIRALIGQKPGGGQ